MKKNINTVVTPGESIDVLVTERGIYVNNQSTSFSWVHISYIKGNNNKINSVSSTYPKIHNAYKDENTFHLEDFTHRISIANQKLLEE